MTSYVGRSIYMGTGTNYTSEVMRVCQTCGTPVFTKDMELHSKWHEREK